MNAAIFFGLTIGLTASAAVAGFILTGAAIWIAIDIIRFTYNMIEQLLGGQGGRDKGQGDGYF